MNVVQRQDESARNTDFVLKIVPYTQSAVKKSRHRLEKSQSAPTANRLRVNTGVQLIAHFTFIGCDSVATIFLIDAVIYFEIILLLTL